MPTPTPTRTLPTRDVTLADGRRLYYRQDEARRLAEAWTANAVYTTKRGPNGLLRVVITVDHDSKRGEHYHLSASYPDATPTPDEMLAVAQALLPPGHYGAMTPESHPEGALHGHVVHLAEDPRADAARQAEQAEREGRADRPRGTYIDSGARPGAHAMRGPAPQHADRATLLQALREELGLAPPFTAMEFRAALDRLRGRRGLVPGALPPYGCTAKDGAGNCYVIPVPDYASLVEREHATLHGLGHLAAAHAPLAEGVYSAAQEREAEVFADATLTLVACGDGEARDGEARDGDPAHLEDDGGDSDDRRGQ